MSVTQEQILKALAQVHDPDLKRDIVSLGFVKDVRVQDGSVAFAIELTTPACPVREQMRAQAAEVIRALPGVTRVDIVMTSQVRPSVAAHPTGGSTLIPGIKNVVPVASGKGGVGKSTVSANLALALAKSGAAVGLMDADVYGPSIPTMLGITTTPEMTEERRIIPPPNASPQAISRPTGREVPLRGTASGGGIVPVEQGGIKVMSMAFFMKPEEAVIWRGPMLHKTVEQFLGSVEWGDLDYLIVDLPPGTGDVQLSLCQIIPITGAVIVSTPQDVALGVAQKAIAMFKKLNAPIVGLIENMSRYVCPHCGKSDDIFGGGGAHKMAQRLDIPFLGEIPLATDIRETSDRGTPIVLNSPESPAAKAFTAVAGQLAAQVSIRAMQGELAQPVKVTF